MKPTAARKSRPKVIRRRPVRVEPAPQLLLASQLIFNIGFYAVVPFLAVAMRNDFGMGAMAIGAGGIPLTRDGKVFGAIGVSGGSGEQDQTVAEAGASALAGADGSN